MDSMIVWELNSGFGGIVWILGECVSFGQCVGFILEKSWNREFKVSYLRAPVELDDKFWYFPR